MLPRNAWRSWEPRFGFPLFRRAQCFLSFSIRPDFHPLNYRKIASEAKGAIKKGIRPAFTALQTAIPLLLFCRDPRLRFRVILTSRAGVFSGLYRVPGVFPPGGSVDLNMNMIRETLGLPDDDYMAIMVMTNGRHDGVRSSPGSYSMTYVGDRFYTTYRTGGFVRSLNDPRKKGHVGFRGINPTILVNQQRTSSLFLINHSSNPLYDQTVTPRSVLIRPDGVSREAVFGPIPPFGGIERNVEDLFGSDVTEFLAPFQGRGTTVTTCPGVTLASLHLIRNRDGSSWSIEHSRPTHTYPLYGVAGTQYPLTGGV